MIPLYPNPLLVILLTIGIVVIKIIWIQTEIKYFKARINFGMFKTNAVEGLILLLQIVAVYLTPLPQNGIVILIGLVMYIAGIIFALWGRASMQHVWGIPGQDDAQRQDTLITTGAFAISRNPIYVGFTLLYLGFAIAIESWLIILRIPLLIYFYKSVFVEEKIQEKKFGEKYLKYKSRVSRFLFF
jgi:protein-S-isoprenylcysteine O-methyltransferase Ste14